MNMVYIYYDNPEMLGLQIACWNSYANVLGRLPEIFLIDDASPRAPALDVVNRLKCECPLHVFRIQENIPWNCAGARNLGCLQASGWIYMSDMDTLLLKEQAKQLFEGHSLDSRCFYSPKRVVYRNSRDYKRSQSILVFHKDRYLQIGGYDEDYAGHYGKEDRDFWDRLLRQASLIHRDDVLVHWVEPCVVKDAATSDYDRDSSRNEALFNYKRALGLVNPTNPLRFSWKKIR
ncbi:MAG TPA: glycosyltransferase family A protein [Opitutales bacterium]|nr:glycosyltransferase family A protein [Opitutales bacterium]